MSIIRISKRDVLWSYVTQFFTLGSGLITLPLILSLLSAEEIGMNYLMMSVSSMVALLDFGFAPQFARNITYVFAGSPELRKEGVAPSTGEVDYTLLANMIGVAKRVYGILAFVSLAVMLTGGTLYIYHVTDGFVNVKNSLVIWLIYSFSVFFNVYYVYYGSLLTGRGLIKEANKAILAQRVSYIILTLGLLLAGCGLMGVVIANLLSPFVGRFISYRIFYSEEMRGNLAKGQPTKAQQKELFKIIWYNAKKLGLVFLGGYAITRLGIFIAGLFLGLAEIASYGLMVQLVGIITGLSGTFNGSFQPMYNALRSEGNSRELISRFAFSMTIYYSLFFVGVLCLVFLAPWLLILIGSKAVLPATGILLLYCLISLLEQNHSSFATFIITGNKIPFVESSLICGALIGVGTFLVLKYTTLGLLGLVLVPGVVQLAYSNWKWPYVVCREFHISFFQFLVLGLRQAWGHINDILCRKILSTTSK